MLDATTCHMLSSLRRYMDVTLMTVLGAEWRPVSGDNLPVLQDRLELHIPALLLRLWVELFLAYFPAVFQAELVGLQLRRCLHHRRPCDQGSHGCRTCPGCSTGCCSCWTGTPTGAACAAGMLQRACCHRLQPRWADGHISSAHVLLCYRLQPARRCAHACVCSHPDSPNPLCFDCADCVYLCAPCPAVDCVASCELQLSGMSTDVISREFELVPAAERAAVYPSGSVGRLGLTLVASQALKTLLQHDA
jgi:hypothetical protein